MPKFHSSAYIAVAATINKRTAKCARWQLEESRGALNALAALSLELADVFEADNDRFNRDRFLKACGAQ